MAFLPGLKKQINKANQFMSEKISGVEGTKLDDDFHTMERKTDLFVELVEDLQIKTKEFLQPNPTVRAKMAAVKGISKLSGQAKASTYPQPEGTLGEAMGTFGRKLQEFESGSVFADSLIESGESLKQMADLKYALDDNVKQNYLEPLHHLQTKDLKEVAHHRKKLQGRKLDFDCKKRKQQGGSALPEKEIKQAEDKFSESLHLAQMGMHNIMENDVEQISQMTQFAEALLQYHRQCTDILQGLTDTLYTKTNDASSRTRRDFAPKTLEDLGVDTSSDYNLAAPNTERALRPSSSNRSDRAARSASRSSTSSSPRPSSQPNLSSSHPPPSSSNHHLTSLDPWEAAESWTVPSAPRPTSTGPTVGRAHAQGRNEGAAAHAQGRSAAAVGWTVFPEASEPRMAWPASASSKQTQNSSNSFSSHNGVHSSNLPTSGNLISTSPSVSPAGTPQPSAPSSGFGDWSNPTPSPRHSPATTPTRASQPTAQALYDFDPENAGELGFKEGDVIHLKQKVDDNWYEGMLNGRSGYFPITYVSVLVPLP